MADESLRKTNVLKSNLKEILSELPGMTELLAEAVVQHRTKVGKFSGFEDLLDVYGMTSTLVDQIRPFLRIEDEAFDDPRDAQGLRSKTRTSYGQGWRSKTSSSAVDLRSFVPLGGTIGLGRDRAWHWR